MKFNNLISIVFAMILLYLIYVPIPSLLETLVGIQAANNVELVISLFIYVFASIQLQKKLLLSNSQISEKQKEFGHIVAWCATILLFMLNNIDIIENVF